MWGIENCKDSRVAKMETKWAFHFELKLCFIIIRFSIVLVTLVVM